MRTIEMYFASGWDFFDDYKLFIGAIVIPAARAGGVEGEKVQLSCRFGADAAPHEWHGTLIRAGVTTSSGESGCVVKIDDHQRAEVEQTVWAYARGARKRKEQRVDLPLTVELIVEHEGKDDGQRVLAQDISRNGCKLTAPVPAFAVDDEVVLTWPLGRAPAHVCWVEGNTFGVAFDEHVDTGSLLTPDVS
jgi:hypothetical protein